MSNREQPLVARCSRVSRRGEGRLLRRKAILGIATELFLEHGYMATSMSEIADRLGGSKGTLWSYFSSKERLFAAVVEEAASRLNRKLDHILQGISDQREALEAFALAFVAEMTSPFVTRLLRVTAAEAERFPQLASILYARGPKLVLEQLARYLAKEMLEERMRESDPFQAARQLCALLKHPSQVRLFNAPLTDSKDVGEIYALEAVAMFRRAYAP